MGVDKKDKKKALDKLIADTVTSAGAVAPDDIPHRIKDRAARQVRGELDAEGYAKETTKQKK